MASGNTASVRVARRYKLKLNLLDCLKSLEEGAPVGCISRDVSRYGLGIVTFNTISQKTRYILDFPAQKKKVLLDLRWCRRDRQRTGIFHAGLHMDSSEKNLTELFINEGLISGQYLFPGNMREKTLSLDEFRSITQRLHLDDPDLLRIRSLRHLHASHTAYLCRYQSRPVIVAINKHMNPTALLNLSSPEASRYACVFILSGQGGHQQWVQVWPEQQMPEDLLSAALIRDQENQDDQDDVDREIHFGSK